MNAPIASVAGPRPPCTTPGPRASLLLLLILPLLLTAAPAQTSSSQTSSVLLDSSDCCNLSSEAVDPLGPDGPWWNDKDYIHAAHLTSSQRELLDTIYAQHLTSIRANQMEYAQQKASLKTLLASPTATEDAVDIQIARIEQARTYAAKAVALAKLAIRAQFSTGQWKQITKLQTKRAKSK